LRVDQQAAVGERASIGRGIATGFVALACACGLAGLCGWLLDIPVLRHFGLAGVPIWPLSAIGYLALSLGFLLHIGERSRPAQALWVVPSAIALVALVQSAAGLDLGIDRLLFGEAVARYAAPHPGRPGVATSMIFLLLAAAGYATRRRRSFHDDSGSLLASTVLALGAASIVLVLLSGSPVVPTRHFSSLPGTIAAVALALGFMLWNADFSWARLLAAHPSDRRTLRLLIPLVLLLPLAPSLLVMLFLPAGARFPIESEIAIAVGNIAIVALVAYAAVVRIARGQAALLEFAGALDSATVALATADGRITHWSHGCEQLYGWSAAEAVGQNKYALTRARCQQGWAAGMPSPAGDGAQELIEVHRDGRELVVLERSHRVESRGREPVVVLSMTDISQAAAAMSALQASEELLAVATATHQIGVFEWDIASGRFDWSPGTEQRLGITPGTITDFESWRAQIEPADVEGILDTIAQAVAERAERFSFRFRFLHPNGNVLAVEGSSRTYYDDDGNLLRAVGVMLDVTEREEREAALRGREAQLRSVLETVPDAIVVTDERGTIREFSAAAEALWGYRAAAVVGHNMAMLAPESERPRYAEALRRFLESDDTGFVGRVGLTTGEAADGRRFPVEVRTGLAYSEDQILFTIFFRDISGRLAAEERLSELNNELAHVSRQSAMSELAADLAHELNQPLSATSNFLAAARMLIQNGEDIERVTELLRMGAEQTLRAGQIIRRLRDFTSRGEVGMHVESLERIVREAVELVMVGTGQFNIGVSLALDPEADQVYADRIQVQQVIVNLLRNAMEALRASPQADRQITIKSSKMDDNMVQIQIRDNGPGIPEHILNNLFTRFTSSKRKESGMGIGLSISRRIIEAHGGTLSAENRAEGGAVFSFSLPAAGEGEA